MPTGITINAVRANNSAVLIDHIKSNPTVEKATRANPELLIAIANAGQQIAVKDSVTDDSINQIIEAEPELKLAAKDPRFRDEFTGILGNFVGTNIPPVFTPDNPPVVAQPPIGVTPPPRENPVSIRDETLSERVKYLLFLLNQIPHANPGDIITSEHHNSLRRAIRAVAASVEDDFGRLVKLTFAPNFQPFAPDENKTRILNWEVFFNKAVIPNNLDGERVTVDGAFAVQLPQNARLVTMIVRGNQGRGEREFRSECELSLNRVELGNIAADKLTPLFVFDLTSAADMSTIKGTLTTDGKDLTDNSKYQYFVRALWRGAQDAVRFEIVSIQISCEF